MKEQLRDAAKLQNKWGNINQRLPDDLMNLFIARGMAITKKQCLERMGTGRLGTHCMCGLTAYGSDVII